MLGAFTSPRLGHVFQCAVKPIFDSLTFGRFVRTLRIRPLIRSDRMRWRHPPKFSNAGLLSGFDVPWLPGVLAAPEP